MWQGLFSFIGKFFPDALSRCREQGQESSSFLKKRTKKLLLYKKEDSGFRAHFFVTLLSADA
jgi:hypothetical protein